MPKKNPLVGIIFKKEDPKKLTTGAQAVIAAGGIYLINKLLGKNKTEDVTSNTEDKTANTGMDNTGMPIDPNYDPTKGGYQPPEKSGKKTWLWVGIGGGVLVLGIATYFIIRRRKKNNI